MKSDKIKKGRGICIEQFKTHEKMYTRARFIGPMSKANKVITVLCGQGWDLTRTGPEIGPDMKATGNFLFIGEKAYVPPECAQFADLTKADAEALRNIWNCVKEMRVKEMSTR